VIAGGVTAGGVSGGTNALGQQAVDDVKQGKASPPATYLKRAGKDTATGMVAGGIVSGAGVALQKGAGLALSPSLRGPKLPADYDVAGWDKFMKANPGYRRGVGAAANKEWQPPETKAAAEARVQAARKKFIDNGGKPTVIKDPVELHHVASDKAIRSGWTAKFMDLFDKAGISLQDDANLVHVEGHTNAHGPDYHRVVYDRLNAAVAGKAAYSQEYKDALKGALYALKQDILREGSYLNRLVTGK
jgi:hypothetical protein